MIDKINHWLLNRSGITYDAENVTIIDAIGKLLFKTNELVEGKTDLHGNHEGSWQGLSKPTLSEEGAHAQVEKNMADIIKVSSVVADMPTNIISSSKSIWTPPLQPTYDEIINTNNPTQYYEMWDNLIIPAGGTKAILGKDQSGSYDIIKYIYAPKGYEKTVIITASVHGWETKGQKILYRLMHHVINDNMSNLAYLKHKVRFIVIPIANPWGVVNSNRLNSRGIDINRNFEYNWSKDTSTEKGTSPLSELETKYINETIKLYNDGNLLSIIDIHNTNAYTPAIKEAHYYASVPADGNTSRNFINELMEDIKPQGYTVSKVFNNSTLPSIANQGAMVHGVGGYTLEWKPAGIYGILDNTKEDVTEGLKFIGNCIIRMFENSNNVVVNTKEPFTIEMVTQKVDFAKTGNDYSVIPQMEYTFAPPCDGVVIVNCSTTFINATEGGLTFLAPVVNQSSHPILNIGATATQCTRYEVYADSSNKTATLTASRQVGVYTKSQDYGDVTVKMMWRATQGTTNHRRSRMFITFIPSDTGRKYSVYEPNSSGDMVQVF